MKEGIPVVVYDPAAMDNARKVLGGGVKFAASVEECVSSADVIVIVTPWEEFRSITPRMLDRPSLPRVVVDCWRLLKAEQYLPGAQYIALGVGAGSVASPDTGLPNQNKMRR